MNKQNIIIKNLINQKLIRKSFRNNKKNIYMDDLEKYSRIIINFLKNYNNHEKLFNLINELKNISKNPLKFKYLVLEIEEYIFESKLDNSKLLNSSLYDKFFNINKNIKKTYNNIFAEIYQNMIVNYYTKILWFHFKKYYWFNKYLDIPDYDYNKIFDLFLCIVHNIPVIPKNGDKTITGLYILNNNYIEKYDENIFINNAISIFNAYLIDNNNVFNYKKYISEIKYMKLDMFLY